MKNKVQFSFIAATCLALFNLSFSEARAQGTAFAYQGRLNDGGNPASGTYDLRFKLFEDSLGNNQAGATQLAGGVAISNGLFTVAIDFGTGIFTGSNYWLDVGV